MADCSAFISEQYKSLREKNSEMLDAMLADIELMRKDSISADSLKRKINDYLKETSGTMLENQQIKIADTAKMTGLFERVMSHPKGPANGVMDVLTPSFVMGKEVGLNVETLKNNYLNNSQIFLDYRLSKAQFKILKDGTLDLDIMRARLDPNADVPQTAKDIAKVFGELKNLEHANYVKNGINKGFQQNYLLNQGIFWSKENMARIAPGGDYAPLKALFREAYDLDASFKFLPADQIDDYIESLAEAVIKKDIDALTVDFEKINLPPGALKGKVIRRNLQPRKLVLKPDGFAKMWQAVMPPEARLLDEVVNESSKMATDVAAYKLLGSNGLSSVKTLVQKAARQMAKDGVPDEEIVAFTRGKVSAVQRWDSALAIIDGSANKSVDTRISAIEEFYKSVKMSAILGGSTISATMDFANAASMLSASTGTSYIGNLGKMVTNSIDNYMKAIPKLLNGTPITRTEMSEAMLFGVQGALAGTLRDIRASQTQGTIPRMVAKSAAAIQSFQNKVNPISPQQQFNSDAAAGMYASLISQQRKIPFNELSYEFKSNFDRVGITEADWDLLRNTARDVTLDGNKYTLVSGRHIGDARDDALTKAFEANKAALGDRYSVLNKTQYVGDIEAKMDSLYTLFIQDAVPNPGARSRSSLTGGTQKGTVPGAFFSMFSMLKSFSVKMLDVNRRIANSGQGATNYKLLASHAIGLYGMGYVVQVLKALKDNETPPDPTNPKTHIDAFVQGGVGGPLADFLISQTSRGYSFGKATVGAIGPAAADFETAAKLGTKAVRGELQGKDALAALSFIPGNNLWYLNAALKYTFLDELKEEMNPGHSRRMRQRLEERQGMLWDQGKLVE